MFHVTSAGDGALELEVTYAGGPPVRVRLEPHERRLLAQLLADEEP